MSSPTVGFIGLGQIGAPMATRLVDWPGGLVVCDTNPDAVAPLVERGAKAVDTAGDVADVAQVISVQVRNDAQVRDVVGELLPRAAAGTVIAIHSTIEPGTAEALERDATPRGVHIVDAPVSGGFMGAAEGTLAVLLGGADDAIAACRPVFERWASLVVHFGPVGAGTRAKIARNLITFVSYTAAFEAQRLAEAAGLDLNALANVVRHSDSVTGGPGAIMVRPTAAPMTADDPLRDIFANTRDLGEKDLRLALDLASQFDVELPFTALALERLGPGLGLI